MTRSLAQRIAASIRRVVAFVVVALAFAFVFVAGERRAFAYPWMIRHDYTACSQCHVDPSGAGLMTLYGRAQSEVLLRTHYKGGEADVDPELGGFVFGLVPLPEQGVRAQVDARALVLHVAPPSPAPPVDRLILMQADGAVGLETPTVRAALTAGFAHEGALPAAVTGSKTDNLVSRQHWAGYGFGEDKQWLARAGRMNVPFGVRSLEHTLWVRSTTKTDINSAQQHGAALSYTGEKLRGELMAVLGNFQLAPRALRERGYAGYVEWAVAPSLALGVSSLTLHTSFEPQERVASFRQAHGLFARAVPWKPLVILAEADLLLTSPKRRAIQTGTAAMLQVDLEAVQGVHLILTGEAVDTTLARKPLSFGGWASAQWFFLPHVDVRVDAIAQLATEGSRLEVVSLLGQFHAFL